MTTIVVDQQIRDLLEEGRFDEIENLFIERLERENIEPQEFLAIGRALAREKEKERAITLMDLLAENLLQKQDWHSLLIVLRELIRHDHSPGRLERVKYQLFDSLTHLYSKRPSFPALMRHYALEDTNSPSEFLTKVEEIEEWLKHDVGEIFYLEGYGAGIVKEINLKLGLVRLDFAVKKDVAVEVKDQELQLLPPGHFLREKIENPEKLKEEAQSKPTDSLKHLLQSAARPLSIGDIKEAYDGLIGASQWTKWWGSAKKSDHLLVSGKGSQARYSWSESVEKADESLKTRFLAAGVRDRIELAKLHSSRNSELAAYFKEKLAEDFEACKTSGKHLFAVEILDFLKREDENAILSELMKDAPPVGLITGVENIALKSKLLSLIPEIFPESKISILQDLFLKEENPKILDQTFQLIAPSDPTLANTLLDRVVQRPAAFPAAFTWICETPQPDDSFLSRVLLGKFLLVLIGALDDKELSRFRSRIKKALEKGLLLHLLQNSMTPEIAHRAAELLEHVSGVEEYRRERWRNTILARFPAERKEEDWIFSTQEALDRKRKELDQLIQVELPTNRKAIGEAAAHGDLRENHEYKAARERQDYLINRVTQLQIDLRKVRIIDPAQLDCKEVRPGCSVTLHNEKERRVITILGPWDSDPDSQIYSYQAPIGVQLTGKAPGEKIEWNDQQWTIEHIEPWIRFNAEGAEGAENAEVK